MTAFCFDAIGTGWQVDTPAPLSAAAQAAILREVERFDKTWSRFRGDSDVTALAGAPAGGTFGFPQEGAALFDLYDRLHAMTDGAVDPLVGRDLERLGYDRSYSLRPGPGAAGPRLDWSRDVRREGATLHTCQAVVLDVGAAGKGLLVDRVGALLRASGVEAFTVDGSGDMLHVGTSPLRVGLEHPFAADRVIGVVEIANQALCASAITRRAWGDGLHHVLDARTGRPTEAVVATWVIAPDAMTADGLATASFFAPSERLPGGPRIVWVRLFANGRLETSGDFAGELFP